MRVLDIFGTRNGYSDFIKDGIDQGRRPELVGGGLIRSLGGWAEAKKVGRGERVKGDERILGDGEFVQSVLREAEEAFERKYRLKRAGINIKKFRREGCGII